MTTVAGTIDRLAGELAYVFEPVARRFGEEDAADTLRWLGLSPPPGLVGATQIAGALASGSAAAAALIGSIGALASAIEDEDVGAVAAATATLIGGISDTVTAIRDVASGLDALSASLGGLTAAQRLEVQQFAGRFVQSLLDRLFVEYVERRYPQLAVVLLAFGAIEITDVPAGGGASLVTSHVRKAFRFDRLVKVFTDPAGLLRDVYRWGADDFDGVAMFRTLERVLEAHLGMPAEVLIAPGVPATLEAFGFSAQVDDSTPPGLDVSLRFPAAVDLTQAFTEGDWQITVGGGVHFEADIDVTVRPLFDVEFHLPSGTVDASASVDVDRSPTAEPLILFGSAGGSRLEVRSIGGGLGLDAHWASSTGRVTLDPSLRGHVRGGKLVITGEGGDGLISEILSALDVEADFDVGFSWSPSRGVQFEGSAGLVIDIPTRVELGPIRVDALHLGLGFADEGLNIDLAATLGAKLGPLTATVERLGARGTLSFPGEGGNLGPAQLDIGFKFPTGVGLSMDTASVKLAGFLSIDPENHRYAGAVELRIVDTFDLTAIGLITTKLPDGTDIFSLLVIITMRFPSPIHIAYNFYLAGVGGLLGLHRSVDLDRLRRGVREGAVDDILFPEDVVANMATIVSDLQEIFPPARDQFLIGPMALITWSSPPLLRVELGLIIELPNPVRIAILGVAHAAIPTEDEPIIAINVAFLGTIDFDKGLLAFDASIYDSFIGVGSFRITFEGDLALRVSWGEKKDFVLSIGGFHPQFQVPAYLGLPPMKRITLSLLKDNPRLSLTCYFALTTNTVQFGAELDFYFGVSAFNVVGNFGFDVLFQFSPFRFIAEVRARLAVRSGSTDLFSLSLQFELQGTTPWIAKGTASFKILFISISVRFEKTWGERREINLPEVAVLPELLEELDRDVTWKAELAPGASRLVQLLPEAQRADARIVDPDGVLTISQNLVPLGTDITRFGNNRPSDIKRADVTAVRVRGRALSLGEAQEPFAPAAFREMSDRDKLASGSYERRKSGVTAGGGDVLTSDYVLGRPVRYEQIVSDAPPGAGVPAAVQRGTAPGRKALFEPLVPGGVIGRSPLSLRRAVQKQAGSVLGVAADDERFTVVQTSTLRAANAASASLSRADAEARLRTLVAAGANPKDLDIVPAFEAAG